MTERIDFRVEPAHKQVLAGIARRRGCKISDLSREAVIAYFDLATEATESIETLADGNTDVRNA